MNKILFKLIEGKGKFFLNGDLKNGEIVNPDIMHWNYLQDGDTFDLPSGFGFEEFEKCIECDARTSEDCKNSPDDCDVRNRNFIRLLLEKPVQKHSICWDCMTLEDYLKLIGTDRNNATAVTIWTTLEQNGFIIMVDHYKDKARKEGFNEALEELKQRLIERGVDSRDDYNGQIIFEEIEKLKR